MTTISQIPKPEAGRFKSGRKLFLVPLFPLPYNTSTEGEKIVQKYWSQTTAQIGNLENQLGKINNIYHESIFENEEQAFNLIKSTNAKGEFFIRQLIERSATLQISEDKNLVLENSDWQRCLTVGLISEKVFKRAMEGYQDSLNARYEYMAKKIDETLSENQIGILFVREDHKIQFINDIQIFFIAPPGLDELKKWLDKSMSQQLPNQDSKTEETTDDEPIIMG